MAGPSQQPLRGQLLRRADCLFERSYRKVMYCYGHWQDSYGDMGNQVTLVEGIPEDISTLFTLHCRPGIIVLDDRIRNCSGDERILVNNTLNFYYQAVYYQDQRNVSDRTVRHSSLQCLHQDIIELYETG